MKLSFDNIQGISGNLGEFGEIRGKLGKILSAAPQQSEICVKSSVFHTFFDVKFW